MALLAPLGACALDAGDTAATDLPGALSVDGETESLAASQDSETRPPVSGAAPETLAEVAVPTGDGKASYRFRFSQVDGVVLTAMEVPFGHAVPELPTECALDTFLRVAAADSVVPPALIEHCLTPAERAERGVSGAGEAPVRAARLRDPAARLELSHQTAGATCNQEEFDERVGELRNLARYVPDVEVCEPGECLLHASWDNSGCITIDQFGNVAACSPELYFSLLQTGLSGDECLLDGPPSCTMQPDPWCMHSSAAFGDFGPYWAWDRKSEDIFAPGMTTRARVEVSQCNMQETGPGWWRMKRQPSDPWGAQHPLVLPAGHTTVFRFSAGTEGDLWDGWDFWIGAEGDTVRVISAWVAMEGFNASVCPILL